MVTMKLQQALAQAGITSRRKAEEMIANGRVEVNGKLAHIGQRVDATHDQITFDKKLITEPEQKRYFLVYKPAGLVSTTADERGRQTVLSLLPKTIQERLFSVGRLDKDSEGLLLLTNDGEYANTLLHPSFGVEKTYEVTVIGQVSSTTLEITLTEGMKHEIRRMMRRIGYEVEKLIRTKFGPYTLGMLDESDYIEITPPISSR